MVLLLSTMENVSTQMGPNEAVAWLRENTSANWSRSKFYRLRRAGWFDGEIRNDKGWNMFTAEDLIAGCEKLKIQVKEVNHA